MTPVISHLDYFNHSLDKQPGSRPFPLPRLLHTILKEIFLKCKYDYISPLLKSFQWLLIISWITSKLLNTGYDSLCFLTLCVLSLIILSLTRFDPALLKFLHSFQRTKPSRLLTFACCLLFLFLPIHLGSGNSYLFLRS